MITEQTVLQAKRYGTHTCPSNTPLLQVVQRMVEEEINTLIIVDESGYLSGIITRTDTVRAYLENPNWANLPVEQFMHRDVIVVTPQTRLLDAARLIVDNQIHQVVVVDQIEGGQRPVALLSATDLVYHMIKSE